MKPEGGFNVKPPSPSASITRSIVAACVVVQLVATVGGDALAAAMTAAAGLIPARLSGALVVHGALPAPLTLLTSLFLHGGWLHLALNLLFLSWVGRHVEAVAGPGRFVLLYIVSGVAGGLLQWAVAPLSTIPVVGASGAIAGIFAAYALIFARSRAAARRIFGIDVSAELTTALWYATTWIGLQLLTAVAFNTGGGGIAIWSHIGGFVVGLVVAQPIARRLRRA